MRDDTARCRRRPGVRHRRAAGLPDEPRCLYQKGWTAPDVLRAPDRLTTPLVRGRLLGRTGAAADTLVPLGWDAALDLVADRIRLLQNEFGPDSVAVFGGGGLTNEKAYALGKLAGVVLRTSRIDYNARFCMSSAAAAGLPAFGVDRWLPFPLEDVAGADSVLLMGRNLAETMPPARRCPEPATCTP